MPVVFRGTHCKRHHEFTVETTRFIKDKNGEVKQRSCRVCHNAYMRERSKRFREASPEASKQYYRNIQVKVKYGITWEQRTALLASQDHRCANKNCDNVNPGGQWNEWHIDHDHVTGVVRGLLCNGCNVALGILRENPERIRGLADYMEKHQCPHQAA